ncbi:MAG: hypothetical protein AMJ69_08605 [Gammaproteobacteria bacterium SG8_47]|nr:MAG: hypothetical protein AMJ69_08605 [Gammaproteobacteria bacterium SG8_47]
MPSGKDQLGTLSYPESAEQAAEYLRLALALIGRVGLAPNPVNFTLCYEYVAGRRADLHGALERALASEASLSPEVAVELYRQYIWDEDRRVVDAMRNELRRLIAETMTGVGEAHTRASQSVQVLEHTTDQLACDPPPDQLSGIVAEVVAETKLMARNGLELKQMLDDTRNEVDALRRDLERTRLEATSDALTGLLNRRAFEQALNEAKSGADEHTTTFCLLYVDIDNFKQINDTYGHLIGDKVIRSVAALLSANVKGKDAVARIGGEEFAVLLRETEAENAVRVGEILRRTVESTRLKRADTGELIGQITVSVGVTDYRRSETVDEVMQRADNALYQSKEGGRNRVSAV